MHGLPPCILSLISSRGNHASSLALTNSWKAIQTVAGEQGGCSKAHLHATPLRNNHACVSRGDQNRNQAKTWLVPVVNAWSQRLFVGPNWFASVIGPQWRDAAKLRNRVKSYVVGLHLETISELILCVPNAFRETVKL